MNNLVYTTLLSTRKGSNSRYVFCHKNGRPYRDVRASLDKAARKARIEAVEVLGKRMDTIWTPPGEKRKEEKIDIPKLLPAQ